MRKIHPSLAHDKNSVFATGCQQQALTDPVCPLVLDKSTKY